MKRTLYDLILLDEAAPLTGRLLFMRGIIWMSDGRMR